MKVKNIVLTLLLGLGAARAYPAQLASPYSNSVFPQQNFTATNQTGSTVQLNGLTVPSTVGSSFASGTITLTGSSLTTVTFSVLGSADNGATFYPLSISTAATPCGTPTSSVTAAANGLYQVSLAGMTHVKFVTSGTFTATSVSLVFTATPNDDDSDSACGSAPPVTSPYTFSTYTWAATGSSSASVITTPAVTLVASDFVFMMCQQGSPTTNTWTASDSNGNTWHALTSLTGGNAGSSEGFYISSANAGSTTFTCTSSAAGTFSEAVVMVYHTSGATGTLLSGTNISASTQCSSGTSCASNSFSTTVPSLVIYCGVINNNGNWTSGSIGGVTATLRAAAGSSFSTVNPACEDAQFSSSQTGITSSINSGVSAFWNVVGAAFQ